MKVVCINAKNRPNEIPISQWLEEGKEYTVTEAKKCNPQGGILGFKLAEISLVGCEPYEYYVAERFRIPELDDVLSEKKFEFIDL